jgi:hypothetical protein
MVSANKLAANKRWGERNKERMRKYRARWAKEKRAKDPTLLMTIRKRRGLPEPTRATPSACECCGVPASKALDLDHCHISGVFRGWLCNRCNRGLGFFNDSIEGLMNAVRYLQRAAGEQS